MHSGLSGDMMLAGLIRMTGIGEQELDSLLGSIMPELAGTVRLVRRHVNHIGGWGAEVRLPHQHDHRALVEITGIIAQSGMSDEGKRLATKTFTLLAEAEAKVHGTRPEDVLFHEVGALDSILDICMDCELFVRLGVARLVASPLPLADGSTTCAHGAIPLPAPAVLEMLLGIPVTPFCGSGETVTPTAIALLRAFDAEFGPWPAILVEKCDMVFGTTVFEGSPNGAVFTMGTASEAAVSPLACLEMLHSASEVVK